MIKSMPLYIGLRYFLSARRGSLLVSFISLLALSGLALGVGLLIIVLSVMNGFDREMRDHILSIVPHVQLISSENVSDWRSDQQRIASSSLVTEVVPFNQVQGLVFSANKTRPIEVLGISPEAVPSGFGKILANYGLKLPTAKQLFLPKPLATALNVKVDNVVRLVIPSDQNRQAQVFTFTVSGIFATHTEVDQILAIASLDQVGEMAGIDNHIQGFRVQVSDELDARAIGYELLGKLPSGYAFRDWFQTHGNLYQAIQLSRNLVGVLIFLIVGIAAFNVVSMLMMSVINKRQDIAILQTLGLSQRQVQQVFLVQGVLIGALGIGIGIILGLLGCYWVGDLIIALESTLDTKLLSTAVYPIDYIPLDFRWSDVAIISLSALCLTLLATLYPARKASKILPAQELRYTA